MSNMIPNRNKNPINNGNIAIMDHLIDRKVKSMNKKTIAKVAPII